MTDRRAGKRRMSTLVIGHGVDDGFDLGHLRQDKYCGSVRVNILRWELARRVTMISRW